MACMQKSLWRKGTGKKKELDNLSKDMIQCKADGFGCNYGRWKALQENPEESERKLPKGWAICPQCGKSFSRRNKTQIYCEIGCQKAAQRERDREKNRERLREYMAKKRAKQKL